MEARNIPENSFVQCTACLIKYELDVIMLSFFAVLCWTSNASEVTMNDVCKSIHI